MTPRALFHPARLAGRPVLSTQSDERLVDLVRAGSDAAFEAIVERYRRALLRYVSRLLAPERAEDVVQQSFVAAYEAMRRNTADLNLRPWLYRIAHNNTLNALRDRGLRHLELDEQLDGVERPDQALERSQGLRSLVIAVQALPERQRDAILLRELEGRSYEEIAVALGVTDGAVRQLLNRARHSLRSAAAVLVPAPLLTRVAGADTAEPVAARVAELVGVSTTGAIATKVCATALVTGAVIGGAAVAPSGEDPPASARAAEEPAARAPDRRIDAGPGGLAASRQAGAARQVIAKQGGIRPVYRTPGDDDRSGRRDGDDDRSGPGGGGDDGAADDRSGRRGGDDAPLEPAPDDGHSGPGGEPDPVEPELGDAADDHSGPGGGTPEPPEEVEPDELDSSGPGG